MAVKGKIPQSLGGDPAVRAVMTDPVYGKLKRVNNSQGLTQGQRKKLAKDEARNRTMIDLSNELDAVLDWISSNNGTSRSQVASYLMITGLRALKEQLLHSTELPSTPSRSARFEWNLELPELPKEIIEAANNGNNQRNR
jgi:hypothetical protein